MSRPKRLRPRVLPTTVEAAVDRLVRFLAKYQQADIAQAEHLHRDTRIVCMRILGMAIRNEFGLWSEVSPLRDATGEKHPDDASGVILRALHKRLRPDGRCVKTKFRKVGNTYMIAGEEEY